MFARHFVLLTLLSPLLLLTSGQMLRVGYVRQRSLTLFNDSQPAWTGALRAAEDIEYGLRFWASEVVDRTRKERDAGRVRNVELTIINNATRQDELVRHYVALLGQGLDALVGPPSDGDALAVLQALSALVVGMNNTSFLPTFVSTSNHDKVLTVTADSYPKVICARPSHVQSWRPADLRMPGIFEMIDKGADSFAIVTMSNTSRDVDYERGARLYDMAVAIRDDLTDSVGKFYNLQYFGVYDGRNDRVTLLYHMNQLARLRPPPDVIIFGTPIELSLPDSREELLRLYEWFKRKERLDQPGNNCTDGVNCQTFAPRAGILFLDDVDGVESITIGQAASRPDGLRRRMAHSSFNSIWAHDLEWTPPKRNKRKYFGSTHDFTRDFAKWAKREIEDKSYWPPIGQTGQYHALGAISGVLVQGLRETNRGANVQLGETFFGRVEATQAAPTVRLLNVSGVLQNVSTAEIHDNVIGRIQLTQVSASSRSQRSIGRAAYRGHPVYPARWVWVDYKLTGDAITALVLAGVGILLALVLAVYAVYSAIKRFINPPEDSSAKDDEDDDDEQFD